MTVLRPNATLPDGLLYGAKVCAMTARGYTSHPFRQPIWDIGARPALPPLRHEAPVAGLDWITDNHNRIKRLRAKLKKRRAVATRYEKTAAGFFGVLCLAAALDWIGR